MQQVIVNSCAVTEEAVRQARQAVRRVARERPGVPIIVTGCAAETDRARFAAMPEVDRVVPKHALRDATPAVSGAGHARAFVEIQNGCDHDCTFCVTTLARGESRSLAMADIVAAVAAAVERGHMEVVLTGVDLTSYRPSLAGLAAEILRQVPALPRLRLSSLDPAEVDAPLFALLADEPRVMPHVHLSLQSGDAMVLKRMKRRHTRADAIAFCDQARRLRPDIAFGADIIAGFPTETEAMFAQSQRLVDECGLTFLHVFPYSKRQGTPAARMPQVPGDVIRDRAKRLRATGDAALQRRLQAEIGRSRSVLIESAKQGRTEHFLPVVVTGDTPGAVRDLVMTGHDGARLVV
jgi:threonylcarbamoyladenosine tRNA methylthiotransferase MtaB